MSFEEDIDKAYQIESALYNFYKTSRMLKAFVNTKGYFIHVNDAWRISTGYSFKELTNRPFIDFVHPDDQQKTIEMYKNLEGAQQPLTKFFTNRYKCKKGNYIKLTWIMDNMSFGGISLVTARLENYE